MSPDDAVNPPQPTKSCQTCMGTGRQKYHRRVPFPIRRLDELPIDIGDPAVKVFGTTERDCPDCGGSGAA